MKAQAFGLFRMLSPILAVVLLFTPSSMADPSTPASDVSSAAGIRYRLVEGSVLIEDWPNMGRPTIQVPIQGYFWLRQLPVDPLFSNYAVQNLKFQSAGSATVSYSGLLSGTYRRGGEVALMQQMILKGTVNGSQAILFDSGLGVAGIGWPWIEIDVRQVDTSSLRVLQFHLVAVPWPNVWFSTATGFTTSSGVKISGGDLLSTSGRIIRRNNQLTMKLGIMPVVPDLGLDAVMLGRTASVPASVSRYRPIWFSLPTDVFSETLGMLHSGDLLSEEGRIVKSYRDFIGPFGPMPPVADQGLDSIARMSSGELVCSINRDFFSERLGIAISNGDLLSEKGRVFRFGGDLLSKFAPCPTFAPIDIGLDAVYVWPSGEVWFSTKSSFPEQRYGMIGHGDLLSSYGKVVMRNRELVKAFMPVEDMADFGLDALEVLWPRLAADINEDGVVDMVDYSIFAQSWKSSSSDSGYDSLCDISDDDSVDMLDAAAFCEEWLREVE